MGTHILLLTVKTLQEFKFDLQIKY